MREVIKRYELDDNLTIKKMDKSEFIRLRETEEWPTIRYYYSRELCDSIEVQITVDPFKHILHDDFDDTKDIQVYDSFNERLFEPFYDEERDYPFLNDLIKEYNRTMDELVEKGIFKEKIIKKNKVKCLNVKE
jgi:hypothetical protein